MVRPALLDAVLRQPPEVLRRELLEDRLVVAVALAPRVRIHPRPEQALQEQVADLDAPVQIQGAEHGLQPVGQDARLLPAARELLAAAEHDGPAQAQPSGHVRQRRHVDHRRAELGQLALGETGEPPVRQVGDHQSQHRVAQELQTLVGDVEAVFEGERAVDERCLQ